MPCGHCGTAGGKTQDPQRAGCCGCCKDCKDCRDCHIIPGSCTPETCNLDKCGDYCCCKPTSACQCRNAIRDKHVSLYEVPTTAEGAGGQVPQSAAD